MKLPISIEAFVMLFKSNEWLTPLPNAGSSSQSLGMRERYEAIRDSIAVARYDAMIKCFVPLVTGRFALQRGCVLYLNPTKGKVGPNVFYVLRDCDVDGTINDIPITLSGHWYKRSPLVRISQAPAIRYATRYVNARGWAGVIETFSIGDPDNAASLEWQGPTKGWRYWFHRDWKPEGYVPARARGPRRKKR